MLVIEISFHEFLSYKFESFLKGCLENDELENLTQNK